VEDYGLGWLEDGEVDIGGALGEETRGGKGRETRRGLSPPWRMGVGVGVGVGRGEKYLCKNISCEG